MTATETNSSNAAFLALIEAELGRILAEKGETLATPLPPETVFLEGDLPIDSLDLATLLVALEQRTGRDPFRDGFRQFTTAGDLADLYAGSAVG